MRDSMVDMAKMNRIQNAGLTIERNRQARQMAEARSRLEQERTTRRIGFAALGLGLLVLIGVVSMMYYTGRMRRRSHSALQRMSSIREQFYTNVTHEFRTPLTVILGLSDELQKDAADEAEVRAKAQVIERQGRGLLTLINHLLLPSVLPPWQSGADSIPIPISCGRSRTCVASRPRRIARSRDSSTNPDSTAIACILTVTPIRSLGVPHGDLLSGNCHEIGGCPDARSGTDGTRRMVCREVTLSAFCRRAGLMPACSARDRTSFAACGNFGRLVFRAFPGAFVVGALTIKARSCDDYYLFASRLGLYRYAKR